MIRRRAPLKRSPLKPKDTWKPYIPKRRAKPRRGPASVPAEEWRNDEYRAFIREFGKCPACTAMLRDPQIDPGVPLHDLRPGMVAGFCDPAHTENNGMRSKGRDSSCGPLCRVHHREYDAGREAFATKYGVDMKQEAAAWWKLWKETV